MDKERKTYADAVCKSWCTKQLYAYRNLFPTCQALEELKEKSKKNVQSDDVYYDWVSSDPCRPRVQKRVCILDWASIKLSLCCLPRLLVAFCLKGGNFRALCCGRCQGGALSSSNARAKRGNETRNKHSPDSALSNLSYPLVPAAGEVGVLGRQGSLCHDGAGADFGHFRHVCGLPGSQKASNGFNPRCSVCILPRARSGFLWWCDIFGVP